MANYFTQHHFSPRWSSPAHHDAPAEHLSPKSTNSQSPHHHANNHHRLPGHMHDTVSRFLQALNFHYGPEDYDVVHPHFDMVETKTCYAVYGELPGLSREDVAVEANDHLFTLTIAGELKRPVPQETNPKNTTVATTADTEGVGISHLKEPAPAAGAGASEEPDASNTSKATPPAAAEEPEAAQPKPSAETEAAPSTAKPSTEEPQAAKPAETADSANGNKAAAAATAADQKDEIHWHVKERRIGHFKRVFRFPVELVEMANIKASIHHGLLCVIVPKRSDMEAYNKKLEEARKVDISQGGADSTYPLFGYFF